MDVTLEINMRDMVKIFKITQNKGGKVIMSNFIIEGEGDDRKYLKSYMFTSFDYLHAYLKMYLDEVEEDCIEYGVFLSEGKEVVSSEIWRILNTHNILKRLRELVILNSNIFKHDRLNLYDLCESSLSN